MERFSEGELVIGVYDRAGQGPEEIAQMMDSILATIDHNLGVEDYTPWAVPLGHSWHGDLAHKIKVVQSVPRELDEGARADTGYSVAVAGEVQGHQVYVRLEAGAPFVGRRVPLVRVSVSIERPGVGVDQSLVTVVLGSIAICSDPMMVTSVPLKLIRMGDDKVDQLWHHWWTPLSDRVWLSSRILELDTHHPQVRPMAMGSGFLLQTDYTPDQDSVAQAGALPHLGGLYETLQHYNLLELPH